MKTESFNHVWVNLQQIEKFFFVTLNGPQKKNISITHAFFKGFKYQHQPTSERFTLRVVLAFPHSSMQLFEEQKKQQKSFGSNGRMVRFYS